MTSMTSPAAAVTVGVDTHRDTHHAAVIDDLGREVADRGFPTTPSGYRRLLAWAAGFGPVARVGVEGTGAYGAALTRYLRERGVAVVEVDRPDRRARRAHGKSDPLDAYAAARAALSGRAAGTPKSRDGRVEAVRMLRLARRGAVKARTQALNQLHAAVLTGPAELREQLRDLPAASLVETCRRLRPARLDPDALAGLDDPVLLATKTVLRRLATRVQHLSQEIREADAQLTALIGVIAPRLVALPGVGTDVAGQLLITAGDNPDRLRSSAAFAHLCGAAPIPASSGRTDRHRLNRGGDRGANNALHVVALCRLRHDPRTQAYAARRTAQGLRKTEILRCLKRYIAREIYTALQAPCAP